MNGIFDFKAALRELRGTRFSLQSLQIKLSEIRLKHMGDIAPETGVRELLVIGLDNNWIIEGEDGILTIHVPA